MFNLPNWQLIVLYLAYIFLMPPMAILVMDKVVRSLARNVFRFYSVTGLLGTPIHELGHVLACWLFGMKITKMRLYSPDPATGRLGYVEFAYRPASTIHAVGLVVQGVAPIFMAFALFEFVFPSTQTVIPWVDYGANSSAILAGVEGAWSLVVGNLCAGGLGIVWSVAALIIALHSIPSWADVRLAFRGGLVLLIIAMAVAFLSRMDMPSHLPHSVNVGLSDAQGMVLRWVLTGLECVIYAVTLVTTTAVAGLVLLLVLPSVGVMVARHLRSRRGERMNRASEVAQVARAEPGIEPEVIVRAVAVVALEVLPMNSRSPGETEKPVVQVFHQ